MAHMSYTIDRSYGIMDPEKLVRGNEASAGVDDDE